MEVRGREVDVRGREVEVSIFNRRESAESILDPAAKVSYKKARKIDTTA